MNKKPFELYLGPCVLESREFSLELAGQIREMTAALGDQVRVSFKGSFDKANRSSLDSFRGLGIDEGLKILEEVHQTTGLPTITDFHLPDQAEEVASVVHTLQVPAFLSRQTDMLVAGAEACNKHGRDLKIKKGQFMAPEDMQNVVDKVSPQLGKESILLTERGTSFGYRTLIVDMTSFQIMKETGARVIFDATHSVQRPGGEGKSSGGRRDLMMGLVRAALGAGIDGLFMEVHPNPEKALSDAKTQWPLDRLSEVLDLVVKSLR